MRVKPGLKISATKDSALPCSCTAIWQDDPEAGFGTATTELISGPSLPCGGCWAGAVPRVGLGVAVAGVGLCDGVGEAVAETAGVGDDVVLNVSVGLCAGVAVSVGDAVGDEV